MTNILDVDHMIDIFTAIKEGKEIQYRRISTSGWTDVDIKKIPNFEKYEYRVKPNSRKYRVGLFKNVYHYYTITMANDEQANLREKFDDTFVRWLSDWIEYKV